MWDAVLQVAGAAAMLILVGLLAVFLVGLTNVLCWLVEEVLCWDLCDLGRLVNEHGGLLAMAPVTQGMVLGLTLSLSAMGIILAVRRLARDDAAALDGVRWSVKAEVEDPLGLPYVGMKRDDLLRIFASLIFELLEAQEMVRKAAADCSVEDYGDRLKGAENRLHGAVLCLGRLLDLAGKAGGAADGAARGYAAPSAGRKPPHGGYAS